MNKRRFWVSIVLVALFATMATGHAAWSGWWIWETILATFFACMAFGELFKWVDEADDKEKTDG